jgi:hypothetical protein
MRVQLRRPAESLLVAKRPWQAPTTMRALAIGALATGALAIGALVIGRLAIGSVRIQKLRVEKLKVGKLQVDETVNAPPPTPAPYDGD